MIKHQKSDPIPFGNVQVSIQEKWQKKYRMELRRLIKDFKEKKIRHLPPKWLFFTTAEVEKRRKGGRNGKTSKDEELEWGYNFLKFRDINNLELEIWGYQDYIELISHPEKGKLIRTEFGFDDYIQEGIDEWIKEIESFSYAQLESTHKLRLLEIPLLGTLERPEFKSIGQFIKSHDFIIITGEAGSGKSGLTINLSDELMQNKIPILFYRVSSLQRNTPIVDLLENNIGIKKSLIKVIEKILSCYNQFFLILDQLDSVGGSTLSQSIIDLLNRLKPMKGIKLIVVCRSFDLEYWDEIKNLDFVKFTCEPITNELARNYLIQIGITENLNNLLKLATNFLNLRIIAELKSININLASITGELSLWENYCDTIRVREGRDAFAKALEMARQTLLKGERDFYLGPIFGDQLSKLLSRGVLIQLKGDRLTFKHEQLQDFLYTWDCFNRNYISDDILEEINEIHAMKIISWLVQLYHLKKPEIEIKFLESVFNE